MRPVLITLATLLIVGLAAVAGLFWRDLANVRAAEESVRQRYTLAIDALGEIQDSLDTVALGDSAVRMLADGLRTEQDLTRPGGRVTLDRIAEIRGSITRSKERIARLEGELKKRGIKVAGMQKLIAGLRRTVAEKEEAIAVLGGTVDSLRTEVSGLAAVVEHGHATIRARDEAIEERRRELATVFYAVGRAKALAAAGIVEARGGFLGLGRTLQPSPRIDESRLMALDTDHETVLRVSGGRARVVSAQPASSYELRRVDGGLELHILQPREFRKVRQLVIVTEGGSGGAS